MTIKKPSSDVNQRTDENPCYHLSSQTPHGNLPHQVAVSENGILLLRYHGRPRQSLLGKPFFFAAPGLYSDYFKTPACTTRRFSLLHP